jgi:hypothetical protein
MEHFYKFKAKIINLIQSIFHTPTANELAIIELAEAKRELLQMQTAQDYSKRMVEYHSDRIARLSAYIVNSVSEEAAE